jgi:hypothetical protein
LAAQSNNPARTLRQIAFRLDASLLGTYPAAQTSEEECDEGSLVRTHWLGA